MSNHQPGYSDRSWLIIIALLFAFLSQSQSPIRAAECCLVDSHDSSMHSDASTDPRSPRNFSAEGPATFIAKLFNTDDFPARWHCGTWSTDVGWLHIFSDIGIFTAYLAIPCVLLFFLRRRPDVPFPHIIWLFAAFILSCGIGHLLEACIFWWPAYRLAGLLKLVTAIVSWSTVVAIVYLTPKALNLPGVAALARDVAERDRMLKNIIAVTPHALFWKDKHGKLAGGNQVFADLMGLQSADEISSLDAKKDYSEATDKIVLSNGTKLLDFEEVLHREGNETILRTSKVPLRDENQEIVGLVGISVDITELNRSQERLRQSEQMFDALMSANIVGIATCDLGGAFLEANDEVLRILQASREDLEAGKISWIDRTPKRFAHADTNALKQLAEHGVVQPYEKEYFRSDGTTIPILLGVTMLESGACLCFIMDVSRQRQTEADLHHAIAIAEDANRAKSEFLANMSHEMRTPLNGILGFTDVLRRSVVSEEPIVSHLNTIHRSGTHLLTLINDILDLSKIESGKMEFEIAECSPHQIVNEVMSLLRVGAIEKGIQLNCLAVTKIPKSIQTDQSRLRQILMNLVGNAIKFTDEGTVSLLIELTQYNDEDAIIFRVNDTGIGIPEESIKSIFNAFDQGDSSVTRRFGGTGLGLAISHRIAEALQGTIEVESTQGHGSSFKLTVPSGPIDQSQLIQSGSIEAFAQPDVDDIAHSNDDISGAKLLLCEDGEVNRDLIQLVMEEAGANITCVENGSIGVSLYSEGEDFDLILMDMQMPVMDGYTAAAKLRESGYDRPIVALTAHAMRGDEERCKAAGCSDYLAKPLQIDKLLSLVSRLIHSSGTQKSARIASLSAYAEISEQTSTSHHQTIQNSLIAADPSYSDAADRFTKELAAEITFFQLYSLDSDLEHLSNFANWLKGAGGTVGFDCFTTLAIDLENALADRDDEQMGLIFEQIKDLQQTIGSQDDTIPRSPLL